MFADIVNKKVNQTTHNYSHQKGGEPTAYCRLRGWLLKALKGEWRQVVLRRFTLREQAGNLSQYGSEFKTVSAQTGYHQRVAVAW